MKVNMNKMKKKNLKQKVKPKVTRSELRKQKLQQKKENKRLFFSNKTQGKELAAEDAKKDVIDENKKKKTTTTKSKKVAPPDANTPVAKLMHVHASDDESIDSDFSDADVDAIMPAKKTKIVNPQPSAIKKGKMAARPDAALLHQRELKRQKELSVAARKQRLKQLKAENEEEDKLIHRLEKKLKLNRTKDKSRLVRKMFSNDGLDWALEFCLDDNDDEEKQQCNQQKTKQTDSWLKENSDNGTDIGDYDDGEDDDDSENGDFDEHNESGDDASSYTNNPKAEFTEDIYGRKRDKHGNILKENVPTEKNYNNSIQKYVPPHLRNELKYDETEHKEEKLLERLHKSTKGLLNRLSEANLHKIASGIEKLYMEHARFYMNDTLAKLLNEALITTSLCNERMLQEHMVLLAYLHAHIGSEIGANFLQIFIQQFDSYMQKLSERSIGDKRLNNIVLILSYMYMFRIYEHRLLLEIIYKLTQHLCEKSVECMLLIFQSVGIKLRKDDPLTFKQMLSDVQQRVSQAPLDIQQNLRLKFMVDVLHALKNNNLHKLPQIDSELPEKLRKRLKGMLRQDKYVTTLNIGMVDLLRADQVGKWWIIGSAWRGNINDVAAERTDRKDPQQQQQQQRFSEKLLALARAQHMNTEERRQIFCIIMSAEDYVDAFEKITHLNLKDQRSIAYVILRCCLQERRSNPYYAHLANKFCNYNRKFQLAFQYASWDRLHDINSLSKIQIRNFAKFILLLIARGGLSLCVLKVIDFVQLDKSSFLLMKEIMFGLLLWPEDDSEVKEAHVLEIFERVAKNPKLAQFKSCIRLFIQHFLLQNIKNNTKDVANNCKGANFKLDDNKLTLLQQRSDAVDNILAHIDL